MLLAALIRVLATSALVASPAHAVPSPPGPSRVHRLIPMAGDVARRRAC